MNDLVAERLVAFLKEELAALNPTSEQLDAAIKRLKALIEKTDNEGLGA